MQNRVQEIRINVPEAEWRHCPGKLNPADILSRGIDIAVKKIKDLWLLGPEFLRSDTSLENDEKEENAVENDVDVQSENAMVVTDEIRYGIGKVIEIQSFRTLSKLMLVTSYVLRFIKNCRMKFENRTKNQITLEELTNSRDEWIKYEQGKISNDSNYETKVKASLGAFVDEAKILRLKGRLEHADVQCSQPILLPSDSHFTWLVILHSHYKVMHGGMKDTLNDVRAEYWIIRGKAMVKKVIRDCINCKKLSCKPYSLLPSAPLPKFRVNFESTFLHVTRIDNS